MNDAKDAEAAVKAVLIGTIAWAAMFAFANVGVAGLKAVLPSRGPDGSLDWSQVNAITSTHLWFPMLLSMTRLAWIFGVGREKIHEKTD